MKKDRIAGSIKSSFSRVNIELNTHNDNMRLLLLPLYIDFDCDNYLIYM